MLNCVEKAAIFPSQKKVWLPTFHPKPTSIKQFNMSNLCPIIATCNTLTGMDCTYRNYTECDFFNKCLIEYCNHIINHCERCGYYTECKRETKRSK